MNDFHVLKLNARKHTFARVLQCNEDCEHNASLLIIILYNAHYRR